MSKLKIDYSKSKGASKEEMDNVALAQKRLGVKVDGVWRKETQNAFLKSQRKANPNSTQNYEDPNYRIPEGTKIGKTKAGNLTFTFPKQPASADTSITKENKSITPETTETSTIKNPSEKIKGSKFPGNFDPNITFSGKNPWGKTVGTILSGGVSADNYTFKTSTIPKGLAEGVVIAVIEAYLAGKVSLEAIKKTPQILAKVKELKKGKGVLSNLKDKATSLFKKTPEKTISPRMSQAEYDAARASQYNSKLAERPQLTKEQLKIIDNRMKGIEGESAPGVPLKEIAAMSRRLAAQSKVTSKQLGR